MASRGRIRIAEQQLEERDEVVRVPLARGVGLAQAELAARREPPEERSVVDLEAHRSPVPEAPRSTAGKLDLEGAALEVVERALQDGDRRSLEDAAAGRDGLGSNTHGRTLPIPGTNGGLRWNGTRLRQRRSASKWMSAITWSG